MNAQHPGLQFTDAELHTMETNADADAAHARRKRKTAQQRAGAAA